MTDTDDLAKARALLGEMTGGGVESRSDDPAGRAPDCRSEHGRGDVSEAEEMLREILERADAIPVSMVLVPVPELRAVLAELRRVRMKEPAP